MPKVDIHLNQPLYHQLVKQAEGASVPFSSYCRDLLAQAADAEQRQVYSSYEEMFETSIQILSILATYVGTEIPSMLERGLKEAKEILIERGLRNDGESK